MNILQMSLSAAVLIIVIVVIRALAIYRLPKKTFLFLWSVALCRLLIPFSIPSRFSIYTFINWFSVSFKEEAANTPPTIAYNPYIFEPVSTDAVHVSPVLIIWLIGVAACALFFIVTYIRCRREFHTSLPVSNDFITTWLLENRMMRSVQIRRSDKIVSPLTYGIWHPTVLLPKAMDCTDEKMLRYVLTHEFEHIRRFDTLYKLLLAAAFCIHWFNPLVWVMYILANRDIELSCDETTVRTFGETAKSTYALMLIGLEERKGRQRPFCTNFSKNAIEERIVSIMKISKKASVFTLITALALVVGVTTGFATSASSGASDRMQSASISGNQGEIQFGGAAYRFTINDGVITVKDADGKIVSTATDDSEGNAMLKVLSLNAVQDFAAGENGTSVQNTELTNELNGNIYNYDELVTTYGWPWTAKTKTITKNYNTLDVPASVYYSEYIDGKWYTGKLKRTGEVKKISDNIWQATYTGKINY